VGHIVAGSPMVCFVKTVTCFHINCASISPSLSKKSMQWGCMSCKYQKHAGYQKGRIRYLEQE